MSWLFSQALVEEYSGASSSGGEPSAPLNGNLTPQAYCAPDKMTAFSRLSRFGMTFKPLTEDRGEALLMSYLAAFPARTSPQLEKEKELLEKKAHYGFKCLELSKKLNQNTVSLKILRILEQKDLIQSSKDLPTQGIMLHGVCYQQKTVEPITKEKEYGLLEKLPTPNASDYIQRKTSISWKNQGRINYVLSNPEITGIYGGKLNPEWTEWLMGWPRGWTDLKPLEMDKYLQWRLLHGNSS